MKEDVREGLANVYLARHKPEKEVAKERGVSSQRKNIFILAIAFVAVSIFVIFLMLILNL